MGGCLRRVFGALLVIPLIVVGVIVAVKISRHVPGVPGCEVSRPGQGEAFTFEFSPEQMANAATIAAVGAKLGLPAHATTIALATAMQESKLRNLAGGDRDSVGLFQQRPSQGWGAVEQLQDPVYAASAFYRRLMQLPRWQDLPITEAAQEVQRSALPDAYAQWELHARTAAAALAGQFPAALTCRNLNIDAPSTDLASVAAAELGTTRLSGPQAIDRGWAIAGWLVARGSQLGVDRVSFEGRVWTADSGKWQEDSTVGRDLILHRKEPTDSR